VEKDHLQEQHGINEKNKIRTLVFAESVHLLIDRYNNKSQMVLLPSRATNINVAGTSS
jgi:hypothetical protein